MRDLRYIRKTEPLPTERIGVAYTTSQNSGVSPRPAAYCVAFAEFVEATRVLEDKGTTYVVGTNGALAQRPEVGIRHRAAQIMRQFANEFGMTSAARSKVSAEPTDSINNSNPFAGGLQ